MLMQDVSKIVASQWPKRCTSKSGVINEASKTAERRKVQSVTGQEEKAQTPM